MARGEVRFLCKPLLPDHRDGFDLYEQAGVYEGGDLDHRGRRIRLFEVTSSDLVNLVVEPHVRDEDGDLDDVFHPAPGLTEDGLDVLQYRLGLELYVALPYYDTVGIHRHLPRDVYRASRRGLGSAENAPPRIGAGNVGLVIAR